MLSATLVALWLKKLFEFGTLLVPILKEVFRAINDAANTPHIPDLRKAKTPDEKREAARKIADILAGR